MPPPNDDFANRILIAGAAGDTGPTTIDDATVEVGEPSGSNCPPLPHQTIWFEWVAPTDGCVTFDLSLSDNIDTTLAVWTGSSLVALVEVASDDDSGWTNRSMLSFEAVNGTSYKIQCGTLTDGIVGQITLAWSSRPGNDLLANFTDLPDWNGTVIGTTKCATLDTPFDPMQWTCGTSDSVWYRIKVPEHSNDQWILRMTFDVVASDAFLQMMVWALNDGFSYPPATPDYATWNIFGTPSGTVDVTVFDVPQDGYVYIGIGGFGSQADFTFAYAFLQPAQLRYVDPSLWRILLGNSNGRILSLLENRSTDRTFQYDLDQPWEHSALVASDDPEINIPFPDPDSPAFLTNNMRKIWALRRERAASPPYVCRWAGIVMTLEDMGADAVTTRYTAYDSWQYLMSRPIRVPDTTFAIPGPDGITFTDARASDIALDFLAATVAMDGDVFIDASDMGLIEATDVIPGDINFARDTSVGEAWQQLCATGTIDIILRPIFDPDSRPGVLSELIIKKQAGVVQYNSVFGWGMGPRNIVQLSRVIDGTQLANTVQFYTGDDVAATEQVDLDSIADFGVYWNQQTISDAQASEVDLVSQLAFEELVKRTRGVRTVEFDAVPERAPIPFLDYGPGDWVPVWANRNFREKLTGYVAP